jgi:hypothetical protein
MKRAAATVPSAALMVVMLVVMMVVMLRRVVLAVPSSATATRRPPAALEKDRKRAPVRTAPAAVVPVVPESVNHALPPNVLIVLSCIKIYLYTSELSRGRREQYPVEVPSCGAP